MTYQFKAAPCYGMALIETTKGVKRARLTTDLAKIRAIQAANVQRHQNAANVAKNERRAPKTAR